MGCIPLLKIISCLIWFDERPKDLREMARSLAGLADGVAAVDGAFKDFPRGPDTEPWSSSDQLQALAEGCAEAGLELLSFQPVKDGVWPTEEGNEVEKRNSTLALAGLMGADWVFNCDADMFVYQAGATREKLARTKCQVAVSDIEGQPTRNVYRWSPGLRHFQTHWLVINEWGEVLSGPSKRQRDRLGLGTFLRALDLTDDLLFDHPEREDFWRRVRQNKWYSIRNERGLEDLP